MTKVVSLAFRRQSREEFHENLDAAVAFESRADKYAEIDGYLIARDKAVITSAIRDLAHRIGHKETLQFLDAALKEAFR